MIATANGSQVWRPETFIQQRVLTHRISEGGYVPTESFEDELRSNGDTSFRVIPLRSGLAPARCFRECVSAARESHGPIGNCLHLYTEIQYAEMQLFLDPQGLAGFALAGSELVSVFSHRERLPKRTMRNLVALAVQLGGIRLNAFDTILPHLYGRCGFARVARLAWKDEHAPVGWSFQCTSHWNGGRPDVIFMTHGEHRASERIVSSFESGIEAQFIALDTRHDWSAHHA